MNFKQLQLLMIAVLIGAVSVLADTVIFFDDFEDDTIDGAPVIGTGNIGSEWEIKAPGVDNTKGPFVKTNDTQTTQFIEVGDTLNNGDHTVAAIAKFNSAALNLLKVELDFAVDYTPAGTTTAQIIGKDASGETSFHIEISRGKNAIDVRNYDNGTGSDILTLGTISDQWFHMTLALGETDFDLTVGGFDTVEGLGYDNSNVPAKLAQIRFEDNAKNAIRHFWVDDVTVTVIPEPATFGLTAFIGIGLFWIRKKMRI